MPTSALEVRAPCDIRFTGREPPPDQVRDRRSRTNVLGKCIPTQSRPCLEQSCANQISTELITGDSLCKNKFRLLDQRIGRGKRPVLLRFSRLDRPRQYESANQTVTGIQHKLAAALSICGVSVVDDNVPTIEIKRCGSHHKRTPPSL